METSNIKTIGIYVTIDDNKQLTKEQFDNGMSIGPEFWAASDSWPTERLEVFCSAKSLAEYLIKHGTNVDIRSGWTNYSISMEKKQKILEAYKIFYPQK